MLKTAFEATYCDSACAVLGCGVDADCSEVEACLGAPPGGG